MSSPAWTRSSRGDRSISCRAVARSLAPSLLVLGAWSLIVARLQITLTANALGFLAGPLGLLLAFRVNSVVSRFHEARTVWEMMIFASRNLASTFAATEEDEMPTAARALCCRLLVAYGWAAKAAPRTPTRRRGGCARARCCSCRKGRRAPTPPRQPRRQQQPRKRKPALKPVNQVPPLEDAPLPEEGSLYGRARAPPLANGR